MWTRDICLIRTVSGCTHIRYVRFLNIFSYISRILKKIAMIFSDKIETLGQLNDAHLCHLRAKVGNYIVRVQPFLFYAFNCSD